MKKKFFFFTNKNEQKKFMLMDEWTERQLICDIFL